MTDRDQIHHTVTVEAKAARTLAAIVDVIDESATSDEIVTSFLDIVVILTEAGYLPPIEDGAE